MKIELTKPQVDYLLNRIREIKEPFGWQRVDGLETNVGLIEVYTSKTDLNIALRIEKKLKDNK